MTAANAAIANHLNIAEGIIASVEEWTHVLFVRFIGRRPRFVSKKVVKMEGTEKQVAWATDIKADALAKVALNFKTGGISQEQYDAILAAAEQKPAKWWIDRRLDFRNSACATSTISGTIRGYHNLPSGPKASIIF